MPHATTFSRFGVKSGQSLATLKRRPLSTKRRLKVDAPPHEGETSNVERHLSAKCRLNIDQSPWGREAALSRRLMSTMLPDSARSARAGDIPTNPNVQAGRSAWAGLLAATVTAAMGKASPFRSGAGNSRDVDRLPLLGWVPLAVVPAHLAAVHVAGFHSGRRRRWRSAAAVSFQSGGGTSDRWRFRLRGRRAP